MKSNKSEGTVDLAALAKTVEGLATLVTKQNETIAELHKSHSAVAETVGKLNLAAADSTGDGKQKDESFTREDFLKILDERDAKRTQSESQRAARDAYVGDKLKDLPAAYRNQLGSDPAKWAAEEQAIREQFKADFKTQGGETKNLPSANNEGGDTPEKRTIDKSKISPVERIAMGLKSNTNTGNEKAGESNGGGAAK